MIESGRSVPDVTQSLGTGTNLIYYWIKQSRKRKNSAGAKMEGSAGKKI